MDGVMRDVKVRILEREVKPVTDCNKWYLSNFMHADDAILFARCELDLKRIVRLCGSM